MTATISETAEGSSMKLDAIIKAMSPRLPLEAAATHAQALEPAMVRFDVIGRLRATQFLAQIAHESAGFRYLRELGSRDYFTRMYEHRRDLGNREPGDGARFCGRGYIQITGRDNYEAVAAATGLPCVDRPEILEQPENAALATCWWWKQHGCNEIADDANFERLTRRINGGLNGYGDRVTYLRKVQSLWPRNE